MVRPKRQHRHQRPTAKVFMSGASQAVRLPMEFRFEADEVAIRREGRSIILSPLYESWDDYRAHAPKATEDFLNAVADGHDDEVPDAERAEFD